MLQTKNFPKNILSFSWNSLTHNEVSPLISKHRIFLLTTVKKKRHNLRKPSCLLTNKPPIPMAAMNAWLSFPSNTESFNHELAIRRFCPARIEQEQGGGEWEDGMNEIDQPWSPYNAVSPPCLAASEEDEFVDSFINMDGYNDYGNDDNKALESQQGFDHNFQGDEAIEMFEMVDEGYEDAGMMVEGEDLGGGTDLMPSMEEVSHGVDQGLQLVHSLLACAEAVGCRDTQLADSMLSRIWRSANCYGDSLQRVSYCFAMGLKSRLSHLRNVNANGTFANGRMAVSSINKEEKMEAFQLLHQTTPYIAFGFMAANEAILKTGKGNDSLHIIDLGMEHCLQWPSLIRTLAQEPEGPPKLRITGLVKDGDSLSGLKASLKELAEYAATMGVPLQLNTVSDPATPAFLTKESLDVREGEVLFVNSIMHLHKYVKESRGSLKAVLQAIKKLGPTLVTVVEQDANHNGPFFLGRFLESLHYYSAIFDSLEASLPRSSPQRMKIERGHFGEEIRNIVAFEGSERIERHERADQWRRQLGRAGFQVVGMKSMSQARMMLSVYGCDGYSLACEKGCLLLGWKGKPIMLASAWQVAKASSS